MSGWKKKPQKIQPHWHCWLMAWTETFQKFHLTSVDLSTPEHCGCKQVSWLIAKVYSGSLVGLFAAFFTAPEHTLFCLKLYLLSYAHLLWNCLGRAEIIKGLSPRNSIISKSKPWTHNFYWDLCGAYTIIIFQPHNYLWAQAWCPLVVRGDKLWDYNTERCRASSLQHSSAPLSKHGSWREGLETGPVVWKSDAHHTHIPTSNCHLGASCFARSSV